MVEHQSPKLIAVGSIPLVPVSLKAVKGPLTGQAHGR